MAAKLEVSVRGRLALLLLHLAAGAAWLSGDDEARIAAAMLAAPLLVDLVATLLGRPKVEIALAPRRAVARRSFVETLRLSNRSTTALRDLRIREPRSHVLDAGGAQLPLLAAGETATVRLTCRSPRRGRLPTRSFVLRTAWPLGLFAWRVSITAAAELLTEPARLRLPADILPAAARNPARAERERFDAQEFWSLREYRAGEDARAVHARRSASLGTLVREVHRSADDATTVLVVDLRRPPGMPATFGRRALELQLSRAASLVDALCARGGSFLAVVIGATTRRIDVRGGVGKSEMLGLLATVTSVAYRRLAADESGGIDRFDHCIWVAAGGLRDAPPRGDATRTLLAGEDPR